MMVRKDFGDRECSPGNSLERNFQQREWSVRFKAQGRVRRKSVRLETALGLSM